MVLMFVTKSEWLDQGFIWVAPISIKFLFLTLCLPILRKKYQIQVNHLINGKKIHVSTEHQLDNDEEGSKAVLAE